MEKWQSLGYTSFGEWRRASERARRAAKKAAASPATVQWMPAQSFPAPAPPSPPCARPRSYFLLTAEAGRQRQLAQLEPEESARAEIMSQAFELESRAKAEHAKAWADNPSAPLFPERGGQLPGQLHEEVITTPRGRREHKLKHTSPGGTTRDDEYVSPAGVQQQVSEERSACWRRLVESRRAETHAHILGCGECAPCREYAASRERGAQRHWSFLKGIGLPVCDIMCAMTPSQAKRSRLSYQMCERL